MQNNKTFLFLTSNNLATNPRLFKEVKSVIDLNYGYSIIQFRLGNWSDSKSDELCRSLRGAQSEIIGIEAKAKNRLNWIKWGTLERIAQKCWPLFQKNILVSSLASNRRSLQILKQAYKLKEKPDLICAHNLAALYPAWKLSKKWNIPFFFDIEDYHPGEYIGREAKNEKSRREFLMKKLLPDAIAITSASPLIGEYTLKLIGSHSNHQVILNSFPKSEFKEPSNQQINKLTNQLKLVWFSQKISFGRGLEQLFEALTVLYKTKYLSNGQPINLTIIGDMDSDFNQQVIQPFIKTLKPYDQSTFQPINLTIIPPLSQLNLHKELANHNVGLALEFNNTDLNRQICLTNKIMTYAQAGIFILATNTLAQENFIRKYPQIGMVCGQSAEQIKEGILKCISTYNSFTDLGEETKEIRDGLSWENENKKLVDVWHKTIDF